MDSAWTRELNGIILGDTPGQTSDGFHTFDELYEHRTALFAALGTILNYREAAAGLADVAWRSKEHADHQPPMFPGFFVAGIQWVGTELVPLPDGRKELRERAAQITYHVRLEYWDRFATFETRDEAPPYDGHTPADVVELLWRIAA